MAQEPQAPKSIFKTAIRPQRNISREEKLAKFKTDMAGEGEFVFENHTKGDLYLPKPTASGRKMVRKGEQFVGDSYYMQMVKTHELVFIREVTQPMVNDKLITEQPPVVTGKGQVEYVTDAQPPVKLEDKNSGGDVLLNEGPIDGVKILQ